MFKPRTLLIALLVAVHAAAMPVHFAVDHTIECARQDAHSCLIHTQDLGDTPHVHAGHDSTPHHSDVADAAGSCVPHDHGTHSHGANDHIFVKPRTIKHFAAASIPAATNYGILEVTAAPFFDADNKSPHPAPSPGIPVLRGPPVS